MKVPAYRYGSQPAFPPKPEVSPSPKALREEFKGLSQKVDAILARIEDLKKKQDAYRIQ